jgi:hypothetical protein
MGNAWATQHPATAANAGRSGTVKMAVSSQIREQPQTPKLLRTRSSKHHETTHFPKERLRKNGHAGIFTRASGRSYGPGGPDHASLTRSIPRWRKDTVARGPVRYFMKAATIGPTSRRRRSVTNEIG